MEQYLNPSHVWKIYLSTLVTSQPKRPLKLKKSERS